MSSKLLMCLAGLCGLAEDSEGAHARSSGRYPPACPFPLPAPVAAGGLPFYTPPVVKSAGGLRVFVLS